MEPTNPAVLYKDLCGGRILCILIELDNDVILAVQLSLGLKESDASITISRKQQWGLKCLIGPICNAGIFLVI